MLINALEMPSQPTLDLDYWSEQDRWIIRQFNGELKKTAPELAPKEPSKGNPKETPEVTPENLSDLALETTMWPMIENSFSQYADDIAVIYGDGYGGEEGRENSGEKWTYRELESYAGQIADLLVSEGVNAGEVIVISLHRSVQLIAAQLAAVRMGIVFATFSPEHPVDRLKQVITNTEAKLCLCESAQISWSIDIPMYLPPEKCSIDVPFVSFGNTNQTESLYQDFQQHKAHDIVYIVHTSGSTGTPKGIEVSHGALCNLLNSACHEKYLLPREKTCLLAGGSFDLSVMEVWGALFVGAQIYIPETHIKADVVELARYVEKHNLQSMVLPPVYLEQVLATPELSKCFINARCVGTGGCNPFARR